MTSVVEVSTTSVVEVGVVSVTVEVVESSMVVSMTSVVVEVILMVEEVVEVVGDSDSVVPGGRVALPPALVPPSTENHCVSAILLIIWLADTASLYAPNVR